MPLHKIAWTGGQSGWALWHITESEDVLAQRVQPEVCPIDLVRSTKRLEWLAARVLLQQLLDAAKLPYKGLYKNEFGKPFLTGHDHPISLSHSYPYVAVQVDAMTTVGIDIEQPKSKLLTIANRVLDAGEEKDAGDDIVKNCVYWCAKESLYKIHGQRGLTFSRHLHVEPFRLAATGALTGKISTADSVRLITLEYIIEPDYVLVLTKTQRP